MEECCEPAPRGRLAFVLACPACAGTLVFGIGAAFGLGAAALKLGLAAVVVGLVGALWIRNAWRRRDETYA